jgi:undecaprenyl diphosphate synthase
MASTPASLGGDRLTPAAAEIGTEPHAIPAGRPESLPRHVAIIMDGNGRWARSRGLPRIEGHRRGVASVRRTTEHCARLGEERTLLMEQRVRLTMIGRRDGLPPETLAALDRTAELTAGNGGMRLCLAINYGARAEIVEAAKRLAREVRDGSLDPEAIDEERFSLALDTAGMSDPDLLIRTAGEMRVSNFLLWQISYAELWVTDAAWPDFDEGQLDAALASYAARERRFGGLGKP